MVHRTRALIVRQRTMAANALRVVCNPCVVNLVKLARAVFDERDAQHMLPDMAQVALTTLVRRLLELEDELRKLDRVLHEWHRQNEASSAGGSSRHRRDHGHGDRGHGQQSRPVPLRPLVRGLARRRSQTELKR